MTRRTLLGAVMATGVLAGCGAGPSDGVTGKDSPGGLAHPSLPTIASAASAGASMPPRRVTYGSDPSQWADLYLPVRSTVRPFPAVAVILHGGFWRTAYDASLGAPLAQDLAARGIPAWNVEYRRVGGGAGGGGGWPGTLADVAAAIDRLTGLIGSAGSDLGLMPDDLAHVVTIGHSAGGQLAVWAAARGGLPAGAPGAAGAAAVRVVGAVAQAGVLDLVGAANAGVGGTAVPDLLGGSPAAVADRYLVASPTARLPIGVPVRCVHALGDQNVPYSQSVDYVKAARAAGDDATLSTVAGDHFTLIDVTSPAWATAVGLATTLWRG